MFPLPKQVLLELSLEDFKGNMYKVDINNYVPNKIRDIELYEIKENIMLMDW